MESRKLGNIYGFDGGNYAGNVYEKNDIAPTLTNMQGGCRQPMIIDEVKELGFMDNGTGKHQSNTVVDEKGLAPTITTINGGGTQQIKVLTEQSIVAMRGRNPGNPSDRTVGAPTEQRLEPNSQGICNTLTSVQKDNLVMERKCISIKGKENEVASTILAGYERTNMTGFNADNAVCENVYDFYNNKLKSDGICGTLTTHGNTNFPACGTFGKIEKVGQISNDGSQYGTVISENGISSNLVAGTHGYANNCIQTLYRIRKLTPKECWRLMDFTDEDFEKAAQVNSNTQLYKQAGNSIVRNVLVAIIGQMIPGKENMYKE